MDFGFFSLLPPLLAVFLAIKTKQVYPSLLLSLILGYLIMNDWSILNAFLGTLDALVEVFSSKGNTRTILFTLLIGSLILLMNKLGGVSGFVKWSEEFLKKHSSKMGLDQRIIVQLMVIFTGMVLFIESSISILTSGTIFRPVFERLGLSSEKLAYLTDSTSAPSSILIPINAWGAYIMSLLVVQGFENPLSVLINAMVYNFYPMLAVLLAVGTVLLNKNIGLMRSSSFTKKPPYVTEDQQTKSSSEDIIYMILPLSLMVVLVPFFLIYTGWSEEIDTNQSFGGVVFDAVANGSGSSSVLYAVSVAIIVLISMGLIRKKYKLKAMMDFSLKGMEPMLSMSGLMVLAFAMGNLCKLLGTGDYVAASVSSVLSPVLLPAIVFVISGFIAFATGTSWGTFAIMIPIAIPLSSAVEANLYMSMAAVMGGGVFGDHCSPISDTTLLASMSSGSDHINHVKTQLPYALISGGVAVIFYLVIALLQSL